MAPVVREGAKRWSTLAMYPGMARVTVWSLLSKTIEKPRYFAGPVYSDRV